MTTSMPSLRQQKERLLRLRREKQRRQEERQKAETKAKCEASLAAFIRAAWHVTEPTTPLDWGAHLDALCLHLEAVSRGEIQNLLITIPPGCTKSLTVCVFWPAWTWTTLPSTRWLFAANADDLTIRDAVACRRLLDSEWFTDLWGDAFFLTSDQNVKSWYENSARGWRTSITVGANVTGKKGDILVVDDPHDARKVESAADRQKVSTWWDQAFYNRVNDERTGRRVVIGQRTHVKDLQGHLLETGNFTELRLPEEFVPSKKSSTSIGWSDWRTEPGELLRPERFGPKQVEDAQRRLGPQGYSGQHQQDPVPSKGVRFDKAWFRRYRIEHLEFGQGGEIVCESLGKRYRWDECWRFQTCDPAASAEDLVKQNDPCWTVVSTWAVTPDMHLVWLDCFRFRLDIPDIVPRLKEEYAIHRPRYIGIEAVASNRAVFQHALRTSMVVKELSPMGEDKLVRATPAIILCETGRVWFPCEAHWLAEAENELLMFTGDKKKDLFTDIVDCLSYAAACLEEHDASAAGEPMALGGRAW